MTYAHLTTLLTDVTMVAFVTERTRSMLRVTEVFLTLTEVFPCFFLSCKANPGVKLAKTGDGLHSSTLVVIYVVRFLFVLFYVLFVCKCVLTPGDNPTAVNKYISINNVYQEPTARTHAPVKNTARSVSQSHGRPSLRRH